MKICNCGKQFIPNSNRQKYCKDCARAVKLEADRNRRPKISADEKARKAEKVARNRDRARLGGANIVEVVNGEIKEVRSVRKLPEGYKTREDILRESYQDIDTKNMTLPVKSKMSLEKIEAHNKRIQDEDALESSWETFGKEYVKKFKKDKEKS